MPGFILHTGAVVNCTHAIPAQIPPIQPRVLVSGQPVATMASQILVAGCPFTIPGPKPQPCLTIKWLMPAVRVLVMGQPPLLQPTPGPGQGLCLSPEQIPNGPPIVAAMQPRVIAT
jgi:hypothetical protein